VVIFFVLSGYVVAFVADTRERTWRAFWVSRFARVYSVALPAPLLTHLLIGPKILVMLPVWAIGVFLYCYRPWHRIPVGESIRLHQNQGVKFFCASSPPETEWMFNDNDFYNDVLRIKKISLVPLKVTMSVNFT
jgi:hypothetical protein